MEKMILSKLKIDKRSATFILLNKELCNRIIKETPIKIKEFSKETGISKATIYNLIKKNLISSFRNKNTQGATVFIFKEDIEYYSNMLYNNAYYTNRIIDETIGLYLNIADSYLNERDLYIIRNILKGDSYNKLSESLNITRERIRQLFNRGIRKLRMHKHLLLNIDELRDEYNFLKYEIKHLKAKRILLSKDNIKDKITIDKVKGYKKIVDLDLSARTLHCLNAADIEYVYQIVQHSRNDLLRYRNFGKKSLIEIEDYLESVDLNFKQ